MDIAGVRIVVSITDKVMAFVIVIVNIAGIVRTLGIVLINIVINTVINVYIIVVRYNVVSVFVTDVVIV